MREILFRGKRVDNGEWVFGCLIQCAITGKQYIFPAGSDANESEKVGEDGCLKLVTFEVTPETVGQYVGLTDKNGKRIFEGDIIYYGNCIEQGVGLVAIMDFLQVQVRWTRQSTPYPTESSGISVICCSDEVEVISNIHDNPELLEGAAE